MTERLLLTTPELADRLGITKRQIRRLVLANKLPAPVYFDRWPRWPSDLIESWIAAGCPEQPRPVKS